MTEGQGVAQRDEDQRSDPEGSEQQNRGQRQAGKPWRFEDTAGETEHSPIPALQKERETDQQRSRLPQTVASDDAYPDQGDGKEHRQRSEDHLRRPASDEHRHQEAGCESCDQQQQEAASPFGRSPSIFIARC